jgi:hypothetical protein
MKNSERPAHPVDSQSQSEHYHGLTKRESFAMAALQGLCANPAYLDMGYERLAKESVIAADRLLHALEN